MSLDKEQANEIEALYKEMSTKLYIYAVNALGSSSLAEEAVQEVFRIVCTKPEEVLTSVNPAGWLIVALKNVINNMRRSQARLSRLLISAVAYEDIIMESEEKAENYELLYSDLMKKEEFELLKKIAVEKYSIREAAEELGINVEACKKRVQRAKNKLRQLLEEIDRK